MIILDADVLVIDLANYANDPNLALTRKFLGHLVANKVARGITTQGLLEVVGKRSFKRPSR